MGHMTIKRRIMKGRRKKALLIGAGSILDMQGVRTYNQMRAMMPETEIATPRTTYAAAARTLTPPSSRKSLAR